MARAKNPEGFSKTLGHKALVLRDSFALHSIHNRLILAVGVQPEPGLPEKVHFAIVYVRSERWISEYQVDRVVWNLVHRCRGTVDDCNLPLKLLCGCFQMI